LANEGIVELRWKKWEEGNWLSAVDLLPEQADTLYRLLRRTPRSCQQADLLALLAAQSPSPGWYADFVTWAAAQITQHRAAAPLALDAPQTNADLLTALATIAQLDTPTSERTLSTQLFGKSKRLAELRQMIIKVLRQFTPDATQFGEDDRALLQAYRVERIPEYVPVAGPLVLVYTPQLEGEQVVLDMRGMEQGLALPSNVLYTGQVAICKARVVITVENATSFHELLVSRPSDALVISIGGFASPATLALLHTLKRTHPHLVLYHWGDSDPGGLRILAHLRGSLGEVRPLAMDVATLQQHIQHTQPLTKRDRATLRGLRQHALLADCYPLIDALLAAESKLEQEAVSPDNLWWGKDGQ
jgi:hypothetical protein